MEIVVGILIFLALLFLGMPVYAALFIGALPALLLLGQSLAFFPTSSFYALDNFLLLAIPFFILAGDIMGTGGMSDRLIDIAHILVGKIKGSLGHVVVVATLFFGALTGSSLATVSAIGSIMIPRMEKYGFDRPYATALVICCGYLGFMIPPSIGAIIYAYMANVSVAAMFLVTVVPGIMVAVGYMAVNYFIAHRYMRPVSPGEGTLVVPEAGFRDLPRALFFGIPALLAPIIILGGIYGGIFTPTEASAVAVIVAVLVGFFIYRKTNIRGAYAAFLQTSISTCVIFAILIFSTAITRALVIQGTVDAMIKWVLSISDNPWVILTMVNLLLLFLGMIIETLPILIIVVPLLLPLLEAVGTNPLHVGSILMLNLGIGTHSPPFGSNLFLGLRIGNVPYHSVLRHIIRLIVIVELPVLVLVTFVPQVSLWLPALILGKQIVYGP